jgi:hypothetical protein
MFLFYFQLLRILQKTDIGMRKNAIDALGTWFADGAMDMEAISAESGLKKILIFQNSVYPDSFVTSFFLLHFLFCHLFRVDLSWFVHVG